MSTNTRVNGKFKHRKRNTQHQTDLHRKTNRQHDKVVIYSDGSFYHRDCIASIGYRIETEFGELLHEGKRKIDEATTSTQTEAHACLNAIRKAKQFGPSHIEIHLDCNPVRRKIVKENPHSLKDVYRQIHKEMKTVQYVSVNLIDREENEKAHKLANNHLQKLKDNRYK